MQHQRSAVLNPEQQRIEELFENPSTVNASFHNVGVFFFHFFVPVRNYIMLSVCSLKVNTALFNWSDFTRNCMILSATFGSHFV